jgi:uncharacterized membrane protein
MDPRRRALGSFLCGAGDDASVEAIFLSTFVLISQNRISAAADKRADLDLQISLLAEHEITKLVELVSAMADRMGLQAHADPELQEVKRDCRPGGCPRQSSRRGAVPDRHSRKRGGNAK